MFSTTNASTTSIIGAAVTLFIVPLTTYLAYKYYYSIITIIIDHEYTNSIVRDPLLHRIRGTCIVRLINGSDSYTYWLPNELPLIIAAIIEKTNVYFELFNKFHEITQALSLDENLGSNNYVRLELLHIQTLDQLKINMSLIRYLEAIVRIYNPNFVSAIQPQFFED